MYTGAKGKLFSFEHYTESLNRFILSLQTVTQPASMFQVRGREFPFSFSSSYFPPTFSQIVLIFYFILDLRMGNSSLEEKPWLRHCFQIVVFFMQIVVAGIAMLENCLTNLTLRNVLQFFLSKLTEYSGSGRVTYPSTGNGIIVTK